MPINLTPEQRRLALMVHVATSVGLIGAVACFLALACVGLQTLEPLLLRGCYVAMDLLARLVIVPLALAALLTGALLSWGTHWGFFRHYWVIAKLLLTAFATAVLLAKMPLIATAAALAREPILPIAALREAGMQLAFHAGSGLLVLLLPTALSIYKPRGMTERGRRTQGSALGRATADARDAEPTRQAITITLRRSQVIGLAGAIFILHLVVLHLLGMGHFGH
ncbi:hypothetical protein J7U46_19360 [Pelomonas sp. V22]|uniref:hypothetical protein n=1 Tax=Pelomonas sp. V22 TaxID=2822139 RepID=UPI0024A7E28A|nr:hypothetical protein [Pelomonas sp. V22]MDI4635230.1 hypothetical protein [Pelomonas sp. V22]